MRRGDVWDVRLDRPPVGAEQGGTRPAVIVSRDVINETSPAIVVVPCTSWHPGRRVFTSQALIFAPDGGLTNDSVVMGEQIRVVDKRRLVRFRGRLSHEAMLVIEQALLVALNLPGADGA